MTMIRPRSCLALLVGALLSAGAGAQIARSESDAPPQDPTQVLSDVRPLPAEDRDSAGAVLDASRMGAQRDAASAPSTANAVKPVENREISRIVDRTRSWDDVRDAGSAQVPAGEASGAPAAPLPKDQEKR